VTILFQAANERNYHIFYRLLIGATSAEKQQLLLTKIDDYGYLTGGGITTLDGVNEIEEWQRIRGAMKVKIFYASCS
jgi:myosin heavy subunit